MDEVIITNNKINIPAKILMKKGRLVGIKFFGIFFEEGTGINLRIDSVLYSGIVAKVNDNRAIIKLIDNAAAWDTVYAYGKKNWKGKTMNLYIDSCDIDLIPKNFTGSVITREDKIPYINGKTGCFSAVLYRYCMDCEKFMGTKDGMGIFGITSSLCQECFDIRMS